MEPKRLPDGQLPHVRPSAAPTLTLRPTFELHVQAPPRLVIAALRQALAETPLDVRWAKVPGRGRDSAGHAHCHAMIGAPGSEQRPWSPWLFLDVHAEGGKAAAPHGPDTNAAAAAHGEDGAAVRTEIIGRFAPHPSVWTGFAFGYLVCGVILCAGLIGAFAQRFLDRTPMLLGLCALAVGVGAALWAVGRVGQRLGRGQMAQLRQAVEAAAPAEGAGDD